MKLSALPFLLLVLLFSGCDDEVFLPALDEAEMPSELSLDFAIANDNTGTVTVRPGGRGVTSFTVDFGDGTSSPVSLAPGETVTHVYGEGVYTVSLEAMNINGETTTYTESLTVSYAAPEDLSISVVRTPGNPLSVDVSATATGETSFLAYFGEDEDTEPLSFQEGETVSYVYASVGTYTIRVVALSGGAATLEDSVTVTLDNPVLLPITFEDAAKNYAFSGFGGAQVDVIDNPDASGMNTSTRVGRLSKQAGSETFAGAVIELGTPIDFSSQQTLSVKVWSPAANIPVLLKVENATDAGTFIEVIVTTTVANQWETLTFDYGDGDLEQSYSKLAIFFDFGASGTGLDYYFDDLVIGTGGGGGGGVTLDLPLTFESGDLTYTWNGFGGATAGVIDNPDASGGNTSDRVVQLTKEQGSMTWAGAAIALPGPIDLATTPQLTMKVWSPSAGIPVLLKVEDGNNPDIFIEVIVSTTVANAWETLTFNYSGGDLSQSYSTLAVFFDFGAEGTGATYYFDDLYLGDPPTTGGGGGENQLALPLTFESTDLTYTWEGFGGATAGVIDNPDASGDNTSGRVVQLTKEAGSMTWAGAVLALPEPIGLASNTTLTMKVWSPAADIPVLLKVENGSNPDIFIEVIVNTTVANQWETLTFDYGGGDLTQSFSKLAVFFDFGTAGTGATYYFDDLAQAP